MEQVVVCWLDGFSQERARTVRRKLRPVSAELRKWAGWPEHYTHRITYYGQSLPATWGNGAWWAFLDDAA